MLTRTSNDVPVHSWHSGTFTAHQTGKFIQHAASNMSLVQAAAEKQKSVNAAWSTAAHCFYWHPWVTASGVHVSLGTNVLKICGLSALSGWTKEAGKWILPQVSLRAACLVMCIKRACDHWTSTVSHQEKWLCFSLTAVHYDVIRRDLNRPGRLYCSQAKEQ